MEEKIVKVPITDGATLVIKTREADFTPALMEELVLAECNRGLTSQAPGELELNLIIPPNEVKSEIVACEGSQGCEAEKTFIGVLRFKSYFFVIHELRCKKHGNVHLDIKGHQYRIMPLEDPKGAGREYLIKGEKVKVRGIITITPLGRHPFA